MAAGQSVRKSQTPATLWRAILDPGDWISEQGDKDRWPADASALADLVSPALAAHLLQQAQTRCEFPLLDPEAVRQSSLMNRLTGGVQRKWMAKIETIGIPVVYMKGFAFAHSLYPDADIRTIGDLDILVREADLPALLENMTGWGFRFDELPLPAWGFISDASFMPMVSAEGDCDIDIHVQPDCYPAYRSLDAEDVFLDARSIVVDGTEIKIPCTEHAMLLCLTNAAKDKFGPFSVRKFADIKTLLDDGSEIDWARVAALAAEGRFRGPSRAAFGLLHRLGLGADRVPEEFSGKIPGVAAGAHDRLVEDFETYFTAPQNSLRVLERELLLCTEPRVAAHNMFLRFIGLFRRRRGLPAGYDEIAS